MRASTYAQLSFADIELRDLPLRDGVLEKVAHLLSLCLDILPLVQADLQRNLKAKKTGRPGMTAEQVLRSFILKSVKNWDLRELSERIADGFSLRRFAAFFWDHVPGHDAFARAFRCLTDETVRLINEKVITAAIRLEVESGAALRVDSTVVETDIHFPTDATLLWDSVRTLTRLVGQLRRFCPAAAKTFRNRTRCAKRRMTEIQRLSAREREQQQVPKYRELITVTRTVTAQARKAARRARKLCDQMPVVQSQKVLGLLREITEHMDLADRVIDQAARRVLRGEKVPTAEKIYSIFEPHTDLIVRGKARKPAEFGHKIFLAETAAGLVTQYRVLDGNPGDEAHLSGSLDHHIRQFGKAPLLYAADRGFYSAPNLEVCQKAGVTTVSIPYRGGKRSPERKVIEHSADFRRGQRFRAGVEGRISVLLRGRGMRRCLAEGRPAFEVFLGVVVLANNLLVLAQHLLQKAKAVKKRPRAA